MTEEEQVLAGELALGVLEDDERAVAMRRMLVDRAFAAEVEWWRAEFGRLFGQGDGQAPPAALERKVMAALDGGRSGAWWRAAALAAGAIAACLLLVVLLRPVPTAPTLPTSPARPLLVAALAGTAGESPVTALYDSGRGKVTVLGGLATPPGKSAELWVIPADGKPRALGLLATDDRSVLSTPAAARSAFVSGSALAISIEPPGGSPTGQPTGKVVAMGKLLATSA